MRIPKVTLKHTGGADENAVRRLYEQTPFPDITLGHAAQDDIDELFIHSLITPFYLRDGKVILAHDKAILDAGCGTGCGCVLLAKANPGARVIGIDFSSNGIEIACRNAERNGFHNIEFHNLRIQDLPELGLTFDYVNCDEVLYMQPHPVECLRTLVSVLNPKGILRANLHSFWQREAYYRAREAARILGVFDSNSNADQVARFSNLMTSLRPDVDLRVLTQWEKGREGPGHTQEVLNNALLYGDQGSTVAEMFAFLRSAGLHFISMVRWRSWELSDLWVDEDRLPKELSDSLGKLGVEERLQLFELIHPVRHRLIDFWCATQGPDDSREAISSWSRDAWHGALVHIHPQLCGGAVREAWERSMASQMPLNLQSFLTITAACPIYIDAQWLACLYPALNGPQMFDTLVDRWLALYPTDPRTLALCSRERAEEIVRDFITKMEVFVYLLVEQSK